MCRLFGFSKQAFYQRSSKQEGVAKAERTLSRVQKIRHLLPRCGVRKLHYLLNEPSSEAVGRDYLFDLLRDRGLLISKRRKYHKTTNSRHWMRKYPNIIKDLEVVRPEQLWVADITYLRMDKGFMYLHLLTDAYSKRIVGYELSDNMYASSTRRALERALSHRTSNEELIHHSDRGLQYSSVEYTSLLKKHGVAISMTQDSDPYENAIAERINGILKDEFGLDQKFSNIEILKKIVQKSINVYNQMRPHMSIGLLTPDQAHQQALQPLKSWKTKYPSKHVLMGMHSNLNLQV